MSNKESNKSYKNYQGGNPFGSQAKMLLHLDRLNEYLQTGDTTPIFMEVNPTNKCSLKCAWCISENARGYEEIEIDALEGFFKDFREMGGKAITFSGGGEPTYYSHFNRAVESAKKTGLELGLMTHGIYPNKYTNLIGENFQWARFSLDTLDEDNYRKWKGANGVKKVVSNILSLKQYPVKVGINCNVGENLSAEETRNLVNWFIEDSPADYLQFRPILPRYFKYESSSLNGEVWNYLNSVRGKEGISFSDDKLNDVNEKNAFPFKSCEGHFFEPVLQATGEIQVCMYHPRNDNFTFGNIHENSFREIWNSDKRKQAIEYTRKFDYSEGCQMCCKLTEPNKLIDFLKHPEETPDSNFL